MKAHKLMRLFPLFVFCVLGGTLASAQQVASLPNAPEPSTDEQQAVRTPPPSDPNAITPMAHASYETRKWSPYVDPGERVPKLTPSNKMVFWLHEEFQPTSPLPSLVSAEYGNLTDSDPKYGTNGAAFGKRFGAAMARDAGMRLFSDSVLPTLTHEDPRYYREASGSYGGRAWHAAERMFVAQSDDGRHVFNVSDLFGRLLGSGLTMAYYPHQSTNGGVVLRTWGTAVVGGIGDNLFLEFWPDIVDRIRHRHQNAQTAP
jgi:hypothetical protein